MSYTAAVKNAMLDLTDETGGAVSITHVSLHTADPGTTGANEVSGGSYARQAVTWGAAASGVKSSTADITWNVPGGTTITHVAGWTASTGGTFRGGGALAVSQAFASDGTYKVTAGSLTQTI